MEPIISKIVINKKRAAPSVAQEKKRAALWTTG